MCNTYYPFYPKASLGFKREYNHKDQELNTKKAVKTAFSVWELTKVFGVGREVFGFCVSSRCFMKQ